MDRTPNSFRPSSYTIYLWFWVWFFEYRFLGSAYLEVLGPFGVELATVFELSHFFCFKKTSYSQLIQNMTKDFHSLELFYSFSKK